MNLKIAFFMKICLLVRLEFVNDPAAGGRVMTPRR
jgi:hypothetical protein